MYNSHSTPSTSDAGVDSTPLLSGSLADRLLRSRRFLRRPPPPLRGASRFLRRASGRRLMLRDPSVRVRETAAEQLEESQSNWAYSKPIVVLDIIWNLAFVGIAAVVMGLSLQERPDLPLRLWIVGYVLQCAFHIACVVAECRRRRVEHGAGDLGSDSNLGSGTLGESQDYAIEQTPDSEETSVAKHLESANTMFSFIWWIIGFYWVTAGGETLTRDSPQLYWLCVTFLAFDVVFVVICVAVASLIGIAVCCCLPCIIAILYVMTDQEGATKEDIDHLPKYKFCRVGDFEKIDGDVQESYRGIMTECDTDPPTRRALPMEDCECCICISTYEDGNEIRELPCNHHFHCACIDKWLYINATCPLCKFNILKTGDPNDSGEV